VLFSFMGGVSFPGVSAPVVRWLRTEGYTAFSSFTHRLTLPRRDLAEQQDQPPEELVEVVGHHFHRFSAGSSTVGGFSGVGAR
jgi:hypothetical protein